MHFGDKPAVIALEVAKRLVAEQGQDIDSEAVGMIKRLTYVSTHARTNRREG